jgi:uncharacterized protein (DUF4213/DUF364 family)
MKTNPWAIYDMLIGGIPPDVKADEVVPGDHWVMVRSGAGAGVAMSFARGGGTVTRPSVLPERCDGMPLRELAAAAKSWNFADASLGVAAINAWWNSPQRPVAAQALAEAADDETGAFETWAERTAGKKAAIIGHFPHLERSLGAACDYCILEKRPSEGDYPDSACEFLLPEMDFVFATGVTVINKTLPRLLELSANAEFILVGPSVPLCPGLLDMGVKDLQGFVITDPGKCRILPGCDVTPPGREFRGHLALFEAGKRVSVSRTRP